MRRIVVGVDGSDGGQVALDWAIGEARERGGKINAVAVVEWPPVSWSMPLEGIPIASVNTADVEAEARQWLDRTAQRADLAGVEFETTVELGNAAERLVAQAKGADLLVVGSHGHGRLHGFMLGSVSHKVLYGAPCPVVVVPIKSE